jgi:beta-lactamase regulating signal transducer with metallopeptidase domain
MIENGSSIDLHAASLSLLSWLGRGMVFGTALAAVTWGVLLPFRRRLRPGVEIALWGVVLLKFLIPVGPSWSFSLWHLGSQAWGSQVAAKAGSDRGESMPERLADYQAMLTTFAQDGTAGASTWPRLVASGYLAAVFALGFLRLYSYRRLRARLLDLPEPGETTKSLVQRICYSLGVARIPLIRISDEARAPFVTGVLRPMLVLSRRQLVRPNELETVIVHEVAHLRRSDLFVRCLQCLAGTIVFFWPIVAWVNRRIDHARESACDQWALAHGRLTAGEYARCLLRAAEPARRSRIAHCPACMAGNPSVLERRIDMILSLSDRRPRRSILRSPALIIVLLWTGFALSGAAEAQTKGGCKKVEYANTEQDRDRHAQVVFEQVKKFGTGDLNDDGQITKDECWAFLTAALLEMPEKVMRAYPEADHDQDGTLSKEEAFLFSRGDYDFEKLHQQVKKAVSEAKEAGDEAGAQALIEDLKVKECAAWHVILDRRADLLKMMKKPPSTEQVRLAAEESRKAEQKMMKLQAGMPVKELALLKQQVEQLRAEAARLDAEKARLKAEKVLQKAEELEAKAADLKAKITAKLQAEIEKLEADGQAEKAAQLKQKLAELDQL